MRFIVFLLLLTGVAHGAIVEYNGKWINARHAPTLPLAEHFEKGTELFYGEKWQEALEHLLVISSHFSDSPFYSDTLFLTGVCYFQLGELNQANRAFSRYLERGGKLKHFEQVLTYKFKIATLYAGGAKKGLFGLNNTPQLSSAYPDALKLYDEVIASMPSHDLGAEALFGKGVLEKKLKNFKEAVETFQTLAYRFPKHSLAAEGYLLVGEIYLNLNKREPQNPDYLEHAAVNFQRFAKGFPGDERLAQAHGYISEMKEICANSLIKVAQYYERRKKPRSAAIYYKEAVRRYPESAAVAHNDSCLALL